MSEGSGAPAGTIRQLFEPVAENGRRWYWAPIAVLVLGVVVSITLLVWTLTRQAGR